MFSCLVINFLFFAMFSPTIFVTGSKNSYCEITCKKKSQIYNHTMCSKCPIQGSCAKIQQIPLSSEEERFVLHTHNRFRNKIASGKAPRQPKASNMVQLVWDDELARIAQCWANACTFEHDNCRDIKKEKVGQNIGVFGTTSSLKKIKGRSALGKIVQNWYKEVRLFNRTNVKKHVSNKNCGHYTQLAWATTTRVGCGQIFGQHVKRGKVFHRVYLYCNYAETGNWLKEPVYIEGKPCSKCQTKCSAKYKSLCASPIKRKRH